MDAIYAVKSAYPVFKGTPFCTPTECILWDNLAKKEYKTSKHLPIQAKAGFLLIFLSFISTDRKNRS